jgi:hypothetical protein
MLVFYNVSTSTNVTHQRATFISKAADVNMCGVTIMVFVDNFKTVLCGFKCFRILDVFCFKCF